MSMFTKFFLLLLVNAIVHAGHVSWPSPTLPPPPPPPEPCTDPCGWGKNPCKEHEVCFPQSVVCVKAPCCDVPSCRTWCREPCADDTNPCPKDHACVAETVECDTAAPCCKVPVCKKIEDKAW